MARPAAKRMAQHIIDAKPRVAPLPVGPNFKDAYAARRSAAANTTVPAPAGAPETTAAEKATGGAGGEAPTLAAQARDANNRDKGGDDATAERGRAEATTSAPATATTGDRTTDVADASAAASASASASASLPLPGFAEAEQCVLELPARLTTEQVDPDARKRSREALATSLAKIRRLEASAQAATARVLTAKNALGVLQGTRAEFLITKRETVLGRSTEDQKVDIDLAAEGNASKVSRQQAFLKLRWNGEFCLRNVGRRPVWINNVAVESGRRCQLAPHSLIEVGNMRLLFLPNPTLVCKSQPEPF